MGSCFFTSVALIKILIQATFKAGQRHAAGALVFWRHRIARQELHESHALAAGGGDKASKVINALQRARFRGNLAVYVRFASCSPARYCNVPL